MDRVLQLEEHVRRGEFLLAVTEAERLRMLPDLSYREQGRLFRLYGRARGQSGDPFGALKALEMAIPHALKAKDWDCLGMARAELGVAWLHVGDTANALEYLQAYLLDLEKYDRAKGFYGDVHYNLGLTYRRRRDPERALYHYREAVEWLTFRGYVLQAGETHQNIAWLHCLEGDTEAAEAELALAETFADVCGPTFKVEQLVCRALLHWVRRDIKAALELSREILHPRRQVCTDLQKAHACWIAGTAAAAVWNLPDAQFFAEQAAKYAIKAKDTSAMNQACALKADIARRNSWDEAAG